MTSHSTPAAIDPDQAAALFAEFGAAEELALGFPADGCYARTHLMVQRLLQRGLTPWKAWAFAASAADLLWTEAPDHPDGRVHWGYHVAPVLLVREPDGVIQEMVFDPLLFDRPVLVEEWRSALHDTPTLVRTAPGEPPLPPRGGTGYWPGPDPLEGPDAHARETLEEYRRGSA
ncbi:MAG TPA: protein-glutamine glutaminase family protein [Gemmataceae bacterium]|nr:protein-glutamine glutaminase family protein [Gemmataceae bacterium]